MYRTQQKVVDLRVFSRMVGAPIHTHLPAILLPYWIKYESFIGLLFEKECPTPLIIFISVKWTAANTYRFNKKYHKRTDSCEDLRRLIVGMDTSFKRDHPTLTC